MLKLSAILLLSLTSLSSFASSPTDHLLTVKERLRIHLWSEGIAPVKNQPRQKVLPEEIERALRKL